MPFTNQPSPLVRLLAIVALIIVVIGSFGPGAAQTPTLAGTWRVTQTAGGETFFLVMDFSEGGAAHSVDQSNQAGVGVWRKNSGGNYSATFEEFADSDGNGTTDSRFRFRGTLLLSGANAFAGTVTADLLSLDGTQVLFQFGSGTLAGTRMSVVPE